MSDIVLTDKTDAMFYTIQGEGERTGYPSFFIRTSRCNLRCAWRNSDGSITKCDTPHTSFNPVTDKYRIEDVVFEANLKKCRDVVITGGEPYFQKSVVELIDTLVESGKFVTVETNGTIYRKSNASLLSISPKLIGSSSSTEHWARHERNRINIETLCSMVLNHKCQFKFVVNTEEDIEEIVDIAADIYEKTGIDINSLIWVMPQGVTVEQFDEKLMWLAEICKSKQWKLSDRFHIRIWGSKKGV